MGREPAGERRAGRGRRPGGKRRVAPLRPAVAMVTAGAVLAAVGLVVADERWQLVVWIGGGLTAAVGLLTLGYSRVERNLPRQRSTWGG